MALTHFTFGRVDDFAADALIPAMVAGTFVSEGIAPSGSNQQTTATAYSTGKTICRVATDTAVYVAFGSSPNASTGTTARAFMPANSVEYFLVAASNKAAVVTP